MNKGTTSLGKTEGENCQPFGGPRWGKLPAFGRTKRRILALQKMEGENPRYKERRERPLAQQEDKGQGWGVGSNASP